MKPGAALVDVAIDQGGCFETSRPTTHAEPVYEVDGIVHYCVANMPGAVPITSTKALTNVTLPYVEAIAEHGLEAAVARDPALAKGVNVVGGKVTYAAVAEAHGMHVHAPRRSAAADRRVERPAYVVLRGCSFALCEGEILTTRNVIAAESASTPTT